MRCLNRLSRRLGSQWRCLLVSPRPPALLLHVDPRARSADAPFLRTVNHAIYISTDAPLSAMSLDQFRKTLDVNLTGSFLCIRAYLRGLSRASAESKTREQANVVLIGSTAAEFGEAGHAGERERANDQTLARIDRSFFLLRDLPPESALTPALFFTQTTPPQNRL